MKKIENAVGSSTERRKKKGGKTWRRLTTRPERWSGGDRQGRRRTATTGAADPDVCVGFVCDVRDRDKEETRGVAGNGGYINKI